LEYAFLKNIAEPLSVKRYITNPDITGAAALIHGYPALLGFGITLIKNQIVEAIPKKKKMILVRLDFQNSKNVFILKYVKFI
jgi:hypothetical protein